MATMRLGWFGKKHPSGASTFKPTVEDDDDESRHKGVDIDKDRDDIEKSMKSVSVVMPRNMEESLKQATTNTNAYYSKREGSNKSGQGGGAPSNTHSGDNDSIISLRRLRGTSTFAITSFIVALGCGVSGAFLGLGITSALKAQQDSFDRNAVDLVNKIRNAWADYVNAAAMIHGRCRNRDFSRRDFRELYEYLIGGGLDFQAAQYDPYVPLEERAFFEEVAKLYYQENFPHVEYNGFTGINYENSTIVEPRNEAEFYYPIHYMEPIWGNEAAIDLDYHASGSRRRTVLYCIDNGKPALTDRLRLVQEKEAIAYGVVLMHPGYNITTTGPGERWPYDLASIVIRIPDLLTRSTDKQSQGSDVYIFDKSDTSGNPLFLGGVRITPSAQEGSTADLQFLEEKLLEELRGPDGRLYREIDVQIANKVWTVSVLSRNDDFQADFVFVLVGGSIIFVATIGLAFWVHQNTKRVAKINRLKAEAEAEKASLILESARKAAEAERELNDFIAHEVRNPVAAAMSACSFVKAALNRKNPLSDEESQTTTREDVHIIDNALKFVNDLLRNMLDMHRAANKQLKVTLSPCDILHDVLEPVQAMLIQRGGKVDVEISCPDNMFAMADRLRLKQVMLNLGRNSAKFVDEGFIRLSAIPFEGDHVQIAVEDSGPGIPMEKKKLLFQKYQESLDMLSQGTVSIATAIILHLVEARKISCGP